MARGKRKVPPQKSEESKKSEEKAVPTKQSQRRSVKSAAAKANGRVTPPPKKFTDPLPFENAALRLKVGEKLGVLISRSLEKGEMGKLCMQINLNAQLMKRYNKLVDIYENRVHVYVVADSDARPAFTGRMVGCIAKGVAIIQYSKFTELLESLRKNKADTTQINIYDFMPTSASFEKMRNAVKDNYTNPPFKGMTALFWSLPGTTPQKKKAQKTPEVVAKPKTATKKASKGRKSEPPPVEVETNSMEDDENLAQCYAQMFKSCEGQLYTKTDIDAASKNKNLDLPTSIDFILCPITHNNKYEIDDHPLIPHLPNLAQLRQLTVYNLGFPTKIIEFGICEFIHEKKFNDCFNWVSRPSNTDWRIAPDQVIRSASGGVRTSHRVAIAQITPKGPRVKRQRMNTPNLSQLRLSENAHAPDSPNADNVVHFKPNFERHEDWFSKKHQETGLNRNLFIRERLSMILSKFRPSNSEDIPENCACRSKPSNLYEIEKFDLEYSFTLHDKTDSAKCNLFLQACELSGWGAVTKKIRELYIEGQPGKIFLGFGDRALKSSSGRMVLARCTGLMARFREVMHATGHLILPKFIEERLLETNKAEQHWQNSQFTYRLALFWALRGPDNESHKNNALNLAVNFVLTAFNGLKSNGQDSEVKPDELEIEIERTDFIARVFYECLNFANKEDAHKFFVLLMAQKFPGLCLPEDRFGDIEEIIQLYASMMQYPRLENCPSKTTLYHALNPKELQWILDLNKPEEILRRQKSTGKTAVHALVDALNSGKLKDQEEVCEVIRYYIQQAPAALFVKDLKKKTPLEYVQWAKISSKAKAELYAAIPEKMKDTLKLYVSRKLFDKYEISDDLKQFPGDFDGEQCLEYQFDPFMKQLVGSYLGNFYRLTEKQESFIERNCSGLLDEVYVV